MASLTPDDYTAAWVCALPLEAAAARVMLDKTHPSPQEINNQNAYDFGEVNGHNIVIAYLPSGVYGKVSAAGVVSRMRATFRQLRFALMVGIGGGVPGNGTNDIRLGDVVVSKPGPRHSGVVQYDYGKAMQGGVFEVMGTTNKPPPVLLTHLSQLEARKMTAEDGTDDVQAMVQQVLEKHPHMRERFGAPEEDADLLFSPSYHHINGESCEECDKEQLVKRQPRESNAPHIHYGLIASGDQVMKDSDTRDRLAQEHGILCFEMEAAGLMDELPTLVVRGICDYCDSHKQKQWQGYAALVAAAYAKLLLSAVPAYRGLSSIKNEQRHWVVPLARNTRFVGRNNEIALLEHSVATQDGPGRVAITGLGGVGKTQIALEVAYRIRDRDMDCSVFWIPCTSRAMVEQTFLDIAQAIGLDCTDPAEVKQQVKIYLSSEKVGRWLLIFDNADDTEMWLETTRSQGPPLEDFLPRSRKGRIVFTTRNRKLAMKLAPFDLVPIPEVDEETAFQIMQNMLGRDLVVEGAARALLEQLAFLPLAITQASSYIVENGLDLTTYLALFQEKEQDAVELLSEDFRDSGRYRDIQNPVITTWLISFRHIQQQNSLAADYLFFMAIINPRNIPLSILPLQATKKQQLDALGLLSGYSFTTSQRTSLNLHRLVHMATRNWLRQKGLFDHWVQEVAIRMDAVFPDDHHANRELWREYLPHATSLVHEGAFISAGNSHPDLVKNVADCLCSDARYSEAEDLYKKLVRINERGAGPHDLQTLNSMAGLAQTYFNQSRWKECEEVHLQLIERAKRARGAAHSSTIYFSIMLVILYTQIQRFEEAEELASQLLSLSEGGSGPEAEVTLRCQLDLATIYWKQGRREQSLELYFSTVKRMRSILGLECWWTLYAMEKLAGVLFDRGDVSKSERLADEALELYTRLLGQEHPHTLSSMQNLAWIYQCQGRWDEAEALHIQVASTRERVLGLEHPDFLESLDLLALLYVIVRALDIRRTVLGRQHPETLSNMEDLAFTWRHQGRLREALFLLGECCMLRFKILGPDHRDSRRSIDVYILWLDELELLLDEWILRLSYQRENPQGFRGSQATGGNQIGLVPNGRIAADTFGDHPLLLASRDPSRLRSGDDLYEVD
jgi:nucleoside phosphorylase/tetratricopeptide (TPR) repeat protein